MYIAHVFIHVKTEYLTEFVNATIKNAANSIAEPGIARFDFLQDETDPTKFVLVEVYRTAEDPTKHKSTQHYKIWRDEVEHMMAEPRSAIKFRNIFPEDSGWD